MASAAGFVLSSRGEAIADRAAEAATRHGWEAKVERAESQLATLGRHRPVDVIKAELASMAVAPRIWRRSRNCADLVLEESRVACAPVLGLRKELAAAEAAERLETQLVAGRAQLATVAVAGSVADPQASALAKLTGADEATIRTYVALLLAALIEVGSALGFTLVSVATAYNPPPPSTIGMWRVRPTRRVRKRTPGIRPGPRRASGGFRRGTPPAVAANAGPALRAPWQVRGQAPLPAPGSVPGLQVRSHTKPQLSSGQTRLIGGLRPGSTWIPLAASRRVTRMPISAVGRELRVSSPVPKHASARISPRASSISGE